MRVYFLRHGKAASRMTWRGVDDERPLTAGGEEAVRREAEMLATMDLGVTAIVTSPLARARRTAEIVADALGLSDRIVGDVRLAHGFDVRRLAEILAEQGKAGNVMLVGHEPDFSEVVGVLIGGGSVVFKKGGLARVDLAAARPGGGELVWLLTPPLLGSG